VSRLLEILKDEKNQFYRGNLAWRPQSLLQDPYRRNLLKNAQARYAQLSAAEDELQNLDRSYKYIQILRRMRLTVVTAQFSWRADDLKFLLAIATFFRDYGTVLRLLNEDRARGQLLSE